MLEALQQEEQPGKPAQTPDTRRRARRRRERPVRCVRCGHPVTTHEQRITVADKEVHTCANPLGKVFVIGCFRAAPGCVPFGEVSTFWSWFPGHAWQAVLCGVCGAHLGWRFQGETDSFFGLILDRLAMDE